MSFARMKVWRCGDDKTIFYVRTFPRIWTMAAFPKYPNAFSFSSSINHTYLSFEKFVKVIKTCLHYQFGSYQYPRWVLFWVISTHVFWLNTVFVYADFSAWFLWLVTVQFVTQAVTRERQYAYDPGLHIIESPSVHCGNLWGTCRHSL